MKRGFLVLLVGLIVSCKKDSDIKELKNEIAGVWELDKFIGADSPSLSLQPGNGMIIVLGNNGTFERRQHDSVIFRGNYTLEKKKDCYPRNTDIVFSSNETTSANYRYVEFVNEQLTLSTPNCYQDGGVAFYRRIGE